MSSKNERDVSLNLAEENEDMPRRLRLHEPGYCHGIIEAFPEHLAEPQFDLAARIHNAVAKAEGLRVRIGSEAARDRFFGDLQGKWEKVLATGG